MYYIPADMRVIFSPLVAALLVKDLPPPPPTAYYSLIFCRALISTYYMPGTWSARLEKEEPSPHVSQSTRRG